MEAKQHKTKLAEKKVTWGEVWRKPGTSFQKLFSRAVTQDVLSSSGNELWLHVKSGLPGKLMRNSVPRCFIWGWSEMHTLPGMYPNSRFPESKQVLRIKHIIYTI